MSLSTDEYFTISEFLRNSTDLKNLFCLNTISFELTNNYNFWKLQYQSKLFSYRYYDQKHEDFVYRLRSSFRIHEENLPKEQWKNLYKKLLLRIQSWEISQMIKINIFSNIEPVIFWTGCVENLKRFENFTWTFSMNEFSQSILHLFCASFFKFDSYESFCNFSKKPDFGYIKLLKFDQSEFEKLFIKLYEITKCSIYNQAYTAEKSCQSRRCSRYSSARYDYTPFHLLSILVDEKVLKNILSISTDKIPQNFNATILFEKSLSLEKTKLFVEHFKLKQDQFNQLLIHSPPESFKYVLPKINTFFLKDEPWRKSLNHSKDITSNCEMNFEIYIQHALKYFDQQTHDEILASVIKSNLNDQMIRLLIKYKFLENKDPNPFKFLYQNERTLRLLIENGFEFSEKTITVHDIFIMNFELKFTRLHYMKSILEILIPKGLNINFDLGNGWTLLSHARNESFFCTRYSVYQRQYAEFIDFLKENGAK
eukprot:gene9551-1755_t